MGIGCSPFQLNGNGGEENNLYRRTTRIPEGTRDAISVCNTRRLKKSGRPVEVGVSLVRDPDVSGGKFTMSNYSRPRSLPNPI